MSDGPCRKCRQDPCVCGHHDPDPKLTIGKLITVLQALPPETPIAYADFAGYDDIDAYVNANGDVEIGPK